MSYGVEQWCLTSVKTGRFAQGKQVVAQALFRRVVTPRGTLRSAVDEQASSYGIDLPGYVGAVGYPAAVQAIPSLVRGEWLKDDRVSEVSIAATLVTNAAGETEITLDCDVDLIDEDESFSFTLSVSDQAVAFIGSVSP